MKILTYKIVGYTNVYNPETKETEQQKCLATVMTENPTETEIEKAKEISYNGKYTIEDDGQPEPEVPVTTEERVTNLEEALDLLLSGVTE